MFFFAPPVGSVLAATPRVFLCPFPTGSPMTPASWGVRRMPFGYFCVVQTSALSRRASSCHWLYPRRIRRVNPAFLFVYCLECHSSSPRLYTLHSTPYTPHWLSCSAGSPITLPPSVLLCGVSDNTLLGCPALAHPCARFSPPLHSTLYTLHSLLAVLFLRFPSQDIPLPLRLTLYTLP